MMTAPKKSGCDDVPRRAVAVVVVPQRLHRARSTPPLETKVVVHLDRSARLREREHVRHPDLASPDALLARPSVHERDEDARRRRVATRCVGVGRRPSSRAPSSRAQRARRHLHRCAADDDHRAGRRHARRGLTSSPASPREFEFVTNDNRPTKTARRSALVASARRRSIAKDTDDACDRAW